MIHPVIVHVYTNFQLSSLLSSWEICYEKFSRLVKFENENLPRDITLGVINPLPLFRYTRYIHPLFMFIRTFSFLAFLGSVRKVSKITKFENLPRDITPWVMSPWASFCHYTFLILETKYGISFIEVGPQTQRLLSKMHFIFFFENLPGNITPKVMDSWPLFRYTWYIQSLYMFIRTFSFLAFIVPENSVT